MDPELGPREQVQAWLGFLRREVPAMRRGGWQVEIARDFDHRLALPDAWYADAEADAGERWFDLDLGVVVDGERIALLGLLQQWLARHGALVALAFGLGSCESDNYRYRGSTSVYYGSGYGYYGGYGGDRYYRSSCCYNGGAVRPPPGPPGPPGPPAGSPSWFAPPRAAGAAAPGARTAVPTVEGPDPRAPRLVDLDPEVDPPWLDPLPAAGELWLGPVREGSAFQAIDRLPENYRAVLVLKYYGELSYDEIADAVDEWMP